jgi:hypothetical protein
MKSFIKTTGSILVFLISYAVMAQHPQENAISKTSVRTFSTDFYFQRGIPTGDNFVGNGLNSGSGFGMRTQFYLPYNFYLGGAISQDYMTVKNTTVIGEFDRTTKFNAYFYAGYDYKLNADWSLTADVGYGYSQNKNRQSSQQGGGRFRDTGNVLRFTASIEYSLNPVTSFYLSPSYEVVNYEISTASQLKSTFDTGNYFNIAIGIRLNSRLRKGYNSYFLKSE